MFLYNNYCNIDAKVAPGHCQAVVPAFLYIFLILCIVLQCCVPILPCDTRRIKITKMCLTYRLTKQRR